MHNDYEDPTKITINSRLAQISENPRERRMWGIATHGNTPFDVPFMSEIADSLWNGGCESRPALVLPKDIKHLISLYRWEKYSVSHNLLSSLTVEMFDSLDGPDEEQIMTLAKWVNVCRKTGPVLVHCQAGLNRSGMVVAAALMLEGMDAPDAIALLRKQRSAASLCNPVFEDFLLKWKPHTPVRVLPKVDPGQKLFSRTKSNTALHRTRSATDNKSVCGTTRMTNYSTVTGLEKSKVCSNCFRD